MIYPKIEQLASLIKEYEGWTPGSKSFRNNNPGNVRYHFGGYFSKYGNVTEDDTGFAVFPTYEQGWLYLVNMLTNWAKTTKAEYTIQQLMKEYAPSSDSNDPIAYGNWITSHLGISSDTKLKDLLT